MNLETYNSKKMNDFDKKTEINIEKNKNLKIKQEKIKQLKIMIIKYYTQD